ncbi:hypothetical protein DRN87_06155 [Candidatus Geothermarchaeota archaeon]|nr:MAG: hypothetical protein DRN87_06155 [Candidatus Geothermarchaeota archaeon]
MRKILIIFLIGLILGQATPIYAQNSVYYPMHIVLKTDGGAEVFSVTENQIQFAGNNSDYAQAILDTDIYDKTELSGGVIDLKIAMQGDTAWFENGYILKIEWQRVEYYSGGAYEYVAELNVVSSVAFKIGNEITLWRVVEVKIAVYNASTDELIEEYNVVDKTLVRSDLNDTISINVVFGIFRRNETAVEVMWSIEGKDPQSYIFQAPTNYQQAQYSYQVFIPPDSQYNRVIIINSMIKFYPGLYTSEKIHKAAGGNA